VTRQPRPPEARYPITVELTARELRALADVAFVCTSTDDDHHRINYAAAALKLVQQAARDSGR
jgi:hypothetical protein